MQRDKHTKIKITVVFLAVVAFFAVVLTVICAAENGGEPWSQRSYAMRCDQPLLLQSGLSVIWFHLCAKIIGNLENWNMVEED